MEIPNLSSYSNTSDQTLLFLFKHSLFPSSCSHYIFLSLSWNVDFCGCLKEDKHTKSELLTFPSEEKKNNLNAELSKGFLFLSLFFP